MTQIYAGSFLILNLLILMFRHQLVPPLMWVSSFFRRINRRHVERLSEVTEQDALFFLFWSGLINSIASLVALIVLQVFDIDKLFDLKN